MEYTLEIPNSKIFSINNLSDVDDGRLFFLLYEKYTDLESLKGLNAGDRVLLDNSLMSLDNACNYFGINVLPRLTNLKVREKEPKPPYVLDMLNIKSCFDFEI